jgi:5-formyltetrahydrofolate cyclo-ligase
MRRKREALTADEIAARSARLARHFWASPVAARTDRIACYAAVDGEIDCTPLMIEACARNRSVYLPVLRGPSLVFAPWHPGCAMAMNRFGIPEPVGGEAQWLRAPALGVVLAPLVAFDDEGTRLGMGGGYYDRTFRFLRGRGRYRRPLYLGVGYEFQRVPSLPARRWDIPLHGVVTESGAQFF